MELVWNTLSGESHSVNSVQLGGLQESSCVEEISPGSEIAHHVSQLRPNSGGKSINFPLLQMCWLNG